MNPLEAWRYFVLAGLSLTNFLEQNLDDKELALALDGWLAWSHSNAPKGMNNVEQELMNLFNSYTANCVKSDVPQLKTSQRRVVEVFQERHLHGPGAP